MVARHGGGLGALPRHCAAMWRASRALPERPAAVAAAARRRRSPIRATCCACSPGGRCEARARLRARPAAADGGRALRHLRGRRSAARPGGARRGRVRRARLRRLARARRRVRLVDALVRRLEAHGGELRLATPVGGSARAGASAASRGGRPVAADVVVDRRDEATSATASSAHPTAAPRRASLSGLALLLGLRGRTPGLAHHEISFPADSDAEFDDVFAPAGRCATRRSTSARRASPTRGRPRAWFVLVNAPATAAGRLGREARRLLDRLGVARPGGRAGARSPADLGARPAPGRLDLRRGAARPAGASARRPAPPRRRRAVARRRHGAPGRRAAAGVARRRARWRGRSGPA